MSFGWRWDCSGFGGDGEAVSVERVPAGMLLVGRGLNGTVAAVIVRARRELCVAGEAREVGGLGRCGRVIWVSRNSWFSA